MEANELAHHGILGMKWGVRRYQNKDGSLTPAGKKRYTHYDDADVASLTDNELRSRVNRLNIEKQYKQLTSETKQINAGAKFVQNTLKTAGAEVAKQYATKYMKKGAEYLLKKAILAAI